MIATLIKLFIGCCVNHATRNTLAVLRQNFGKCLMFTNPISECMNADMMKTLSIKGNLIHKHVCSVTSLKMDTMGIFGLGLEL